jgi:putative toxin-antitoxin system antitoxin component (TIGR02293 family)
MNGKSSPNRPGTTQIADIGDAAGPASFTDLMEQFTTKRGDPVEAIRIGFPASLLKDAGQYFDVPAQRIRAIVRLPETTAHTLSKRGARMDAASSERLWRLADVMSIAREIFDDEEQAKLWLRTPNLSFHDTAPMDYLDTEPGAIAVRQVLNAIATGGAL